MMSLTWEQVIIQALDPIALGRWWRDALGWVAVDEGPEVFEIQPELDVTPGLLFVPTDRPKAGQSRLHIDLRPEDQAAEVERLLALGAVRADVGQRDVPWVVLADPEGNEFCVLAARSVPQ